MHVPFLFIAQTRSIAVGHISTEDSDSFLASCTF